MLLCLGPWLVYTARVRSFTRGSGSEPRPRPAVSRGSQPCARGNGPSSSLPETQPARRAAATAKEVAWVVGQPVLERVLPEPRVSVQLVEVGSDGFSLSLSNASPDCSILVYELRLPPGVTPQRTRRGFGTWSVRPQGAPGETRWSGRLELAPTTSTTVHFVGAPPAHHQRAAVLWAFHRRRVTLPLVGSVDTPHVWVDGDRPGGETVVSLVPP
jgi:hypothetical protein